jgi:large subunit ribosomal protein L24
MAAKLKKGDPVVILAGKDRGKTGEILKVFPTESRVLVSGVNKVKRHTKASMSESGGIVEKEAPLHISNVAYNQDGKATRVGFKVEKDGSKQRVAKRTQQVISEN